MKGGDKRGLIVGGVIFFLIIVAIIIIVIVDPFDWRCQKKTESCEDEKDCCGDELKCINKKCSKPTPKPTPPGTPKPTPKPTTGGSTPPGTPKPTPPGTPKPTPGPINYIPPINISGMAVPTGDTCNDMKDEWIKPKSGSRLNKLCNVYYNSRTNKRCSPSVFGGVCQEGVSLPSSIKCSQLMPVNYIGASTCEKIPNNSVKLSVNFKNGNSWNQGLCEGYHEGDNICVGSGSGSSHPCIKSSTKKCYS